MSVFNKVIYLQVFGIKGPTWLMTMDHLDFIKGNSPEYMHCALLGVSKLLLGLWTDTARSKGKEYNIHKHIPAIDHLISSHIETPSEITRKPRGISNLKHWKGISIVSLFCACKCFNHITCILVNVSTIIIFMLNFDTASEYRSWTLYYAVPVLQPHLQEKYIHHFSYFAEGLWLLLQAAPTANEIDHAERLIDRFCLQFQSLYGKNTT